MYNAAVLLLKKKIYNDLNSTFRHKTPLKLTVNLISGLIQRFFYVLFRVESEIILRNVLSCKVFKTFQRNCLKMYCRSHTHTHTQKGTPLLISQFDALNVFLWVRIHGVSVSNFNFLNVNPQFFQRNRKFHHSNCLNTNFHNISDIS